MFGVMALSSKPDRELDEDLRAERVDGLHELGQAGEMRCVVQV